jgi:hypothetical protein
MATMETMQLMAYLTMKQSKYMNGTINGAINNLLQL